MEASKLSFPKDKVMEIDEEIENQDADNACALVSLGDANLGLD